MNYRNFLILVICAAGIVSCKQKVSYSKTKGGMPYQIYRGKDTTHVHEGDFIKIHLTRKINDSVYITTEGTPPAYIQVGPGQPYDISELWTTLRVGDSVVATQSMDTFIKRSPQNIPPQFHKGDKITYYIKVLEKFSSDSLAKIDYDKTNNAWMDAEIKSIEKYLAEKNITAQRTPTGAFVEIKNPGTGTPIDTGNYVSVNYTGTSWSGKKFDSNTDTAFHHVEPYPYVAGTGAMIKGFDEGVLMLKKGAVARVYVPSVLGYGGNPGTPLIKPYENLIFDVEVVDVKPKAPTQDVSGAVPPHGQ